MSQIYRDLEQQDQAETTGRLGFERIEAELRVRPENTRAIALGADHLAAVGQHDRARQWASRALLIEPDDFLTQYNVACVYSLLGEHDLAMDLLERALPVGHSEIRAWVHHDSDLDPLRSHPRFVNLVEKLEG